MASPPAPDEAALAQQQRDRAAALVARLAAEGTIALDGSPESLARVDAAVRGRPRRGGGDLAEEVAAYAGEVLRRTLQGRWVLDDRGRPAVEVAGRARVRVERSAERLVRGDGDGMAALYARAAGLIRASTGAGTPTAGPLPLGDNRPLGLRRSAFHDTDPEGGAEEQMDAERFRRVAGDAAEHTRDHGFGPSVFVWILILCVIGIIAWAAYLYRNAPP